MIFLKKLTYFILIYLYTLCAVANGYDNEHYFDLIKSISKIDDPVSQIIKLQNALDSTKNEYRRFILFSLIMKSAIRSRDDNKIILYANRLNNIAGKHKDDWNYSNAIHDLNTGLGLSAFRKGDINKAKEYLIVSGKVYGSPQLNSYGPSMDLARLILNLGEVEIVIEYLELCKLFWKGDKGKLVEWIDVIRSGATPDFGWHGYVFEK